ncbi:hypothetical protein DNHGIG_35710 [Collibacillus ludicampi]|jgi:hypothetical protein|uniref:Aspartyl-phosphate phosphatase Spo0E family protein n=1 Tax=Collibacillus ludicampi TaxID=2771369 RepID=A0AAV4LJF8_9BACL|nr:hypothetical protein DNHGIG_35710 [Collibacillus ludicampi]
MVDLENLKFRIEQLRLYMVKVAMEKGNFSDPAVVEISQQLDELIIQYQRASGMIRTELPSFCNCRV